MTTPVTNGHSMSNGGAKNMASKTISNGIHHQNGSNGIHHQNGSNGIHQNGSNGFHQNGSNGIHQNGSNGIHQNGSNGFHQNGSNGNQQNGDEWFQEGCEFLKDAVDLIIKEAVVKGVDEQSKVVEFLSPASLEKQLDFHLGDEAKSNTDLIAICHDVIKYSVKTGHPHFFNQLFGGLDPYGLTGAWLTDALNTSQYTYEVAPVFTVMEKFLFAEMRRLVGFQEGDGIFCPGGSISNMYAVNLARYRKFPDVKTKGLWGLPTMCIMTSDKGHYSLKKGAALLGFGMDNVITVKTDDCGRMIPSELDIALTTAREQNLVPIMVNATAGNTVLGAYDPLPAIAEVCQRHSVWLHVDACWGGGVLLSQKLRHKMEGVEKADSVSWNPHKMMGAPLQAAVFLTRHPNILNACHSAKAQYLFQQDKFYDMSYDTGDKSIQCGRKVDVFKVWLMWKAKGTRAFGADIEQLFDCSRYLTKKIAARPEFRLVLQEPECTNVCFWYIPPSKRGREENKEWWMELGKVAPKIKERMVTQGTLLIGYQPDGDRVNFFRAVVSNRATKTEDMDFMLDEINRLGLDL